MKGEALWKVAVVIFLIPIIAGCGILTTQFARPVSMPSSPPASVTIEPAEATNPIKTQHKVKAIVKDAQGRLVHSTLVEWTLARTPGAVGDIIEPIQDPPLNRALKLTNTYAITGTDEKGETSIAITSVQEGVTHIIAYVPDIKDPVKHKAFAVKNWWDAKWTFPPAAINKVGTKHPMATLVVRESDGTPLEGYEVQWRVASGPEATFEESGRAEAATKTDEKGVARATLVQVRPTAGANTINIALVKPKDPGRACCPTPSGVLARGSTTKTWVAPDLAIQKTCPQSIVKGGQGLFTFVVANRSQVDAANVVVKDVLPPGLDYVSSSPEGRADGKTITWELGTLAPGANRTVTVTAKGTAIGTVTNEVTATSAEGLEAKSACSTVITEPGLKVAKSCPAEGIVGDSLNYVVTVSNPGTAPVPNVVVTDTVPEGMRHASGQSQVLWNAGTLAPGASASETMVFVAQRTGTFTNAVNAVASGDLSDQAQCQTVIREPRVSIKKSGREQQVAGRNVTYTIAVSNPGTAPATGVMVEDQLPSGVSYVSSNPAGTYNSATRTVTWSLGTLAPNAERTLEVTVKGEAEGRFCDKVTVAAERSLADRSEACTTFVGVPGVLLELVDDPDPVEVGTNTVYTITVTNQGTTMLSNLRVVAKIPAGEAYVSHTGTAPATVVGDTVTYAPVASLPIGQKFTHTVTVRGVGVAERAQIDVRFEVTLTADQLVTPVVREESTHIYR